VRGISEIKNKAGRSQQYTMLHFIEVFKGEFAMSWLEVHLHSVLSAEKSVCL
jgi:hypothetical protein